MICIKMIFTCVFANSSQATEPSAASHRQTLGNARFKNDFALKKISPKAISRSMANTQQSAGGGEGYQHILRAYKAVDYKNVWRTYKV